MSAAVESFARHASRYGDPAGVLETAAREFPPAELGALVARLRRVPRARDKKNKLWKPTGSQARMLTVAMLDAGVPATTISKRLGRDVSWVREVEAVLGHPTLEPLRRRRNNCRRPGQAGQGRLRPARPSTPRPAPRPRRRVGRP